MNNSATTRLTDQPRIAFFALFFLIFLQLLSDLIETTYVFGLLGVSIPPEVVSVLFLLAPLLLVFLPRAMESPTFAAVSAVIALLCRAAAVVVDTRWKMLLSGLGVGLMLIFFAALFWQLRGRKVGHRMGLGLAYSSLVWIVLRATLIGNDISTFPTYYNSVFALVLFAGVGLLEWYRSTHKTQQANIAAEPVSFGFGHTIALGIGMFSAPLLLYFGLSAPTVIARWTEANYTNISLLLAGSVVLLVALWSANARFRAWVTRPRVLELWNGLFLIALIFLLRAYTIDFPTDPAAYPLQAPIPGPLAWVALLMMLVLHPVIFVDFALLAQTLLDRVSRPRQAAVAIFAGSLWVLLMSFAHVFTTVYDYIPVIGPLFRDNFWLVYAVAGLGLMLPLLHTRPAILDTDTVAVSRPDPFTIFSILIAAALWISVAWLISQATVRSARFKTLTLLTYNIQQGYTEDGQKGFDEQLDTIRKLVPDIIGLQESDTARIAGGNADVVRYFAKRLDYYSYYGPSTVTGTFGIALLSRYPIEDPQTFYLYSEGEQTAAILATIRFDGVPYTVLVTHLGNGGPMIQQQQVLQILEGRENVIAMGDFNFRPGSEQYAITTAQYEDAWEVAAKQELQQPDLNPGRKIDHVFITPGLPVLRGVYIAPGPSDHPGLFIEIGR